MVHQLSLNDGVMVSSPFKCALGHGGISPRASAEHSHHLRNQTASVSAVAACCSICFVTRSIHSKGIAVHHAGVWSRVMSRAPFVLDHRGAAPQPPPTVKRLWPSPAPGRRPAAGGWLKFPGVVWAMFAPSILFHPNVDPLRNRPPHEVLFHGRRTFHGTPGCECVSQAIKMLDSQRLSLSTSCILQFKSDSHFMSFSEDYRKIPMLEPPTSMKSCWDWMELLWFQFKAG